MYLIDLDSMPPIKISVGCGAKENMLVMNAIKAAFDAIKAMPAVDAVPRDEHEALLKRFQHLLKSDYILSFDEVDRRTGKYKRDIREANETKVVHCKDCKHADPVTMPKGYVYCIQWDTVSDCDGFCHKGAKIDMEA